MPVLYVTPFTAAVAALLLVALSLPISLRRFRTRIEAGDGGDETLRRRIRAQGNFIEYAPLALIVMALLELGGARESVMWTLSALLLGGRTVHALGMIRGSTLLRGLGMIATLVCLVGGALLLLAQFALNS